MKTENTEQDNDNTFAKEALQCEIGVKLQRAREEKQLSADYVVKALKFNASVLNALESGNWEDMPGEVYALGFLRQYSALLKVDVSIEIERLKSNNYELTAPLTFPDGPISPNRIWAIAAIAAFVFLIIVINSSDSENDETFTTNLSEQVIPTAVEGEGQAPQLNNQQPTEEAEMNNPVEPIESANNITVDDSSDIKVTKPSKTYSFYASTDDVWLQVYEEVNDADPVLLREVLLKKGQSFSIIDSRANLYLTAGNSRALEILVDGYVLFAANTLGEENKVLKQFLITP
jgi:cytoskeleton protein RodZ